MSSFVPQSLCDVIMIYRLESGFFLWGFLSYLFFRVEILDASLLLCSLPALCLFFDNGLLSFFSFLSFFLFN